MQVFNKSYIHLFKLPSRRGGYHPLRKIILGPPSARHGGLLFHLYNNYVMAKSKSFFGLRTGSTKSLTFQVYRGQQVTKDRVYRVSNPRTESQMVQRALIPIVAASRAALKGLVDHSFEGVAYGDQSLKMFSSLNLKAGAVTVASYSPNGYSNPGFANLIVSRGTINEDFEITGGRDSASAKYPCEEETLTNKAYNAGAPAAELLREVATWAAGTGVSICSPGTQLTFLTLLQDGALDEPKAALSTFSINRILFPGDNTLNTQLEDVNGPWKIKDAVTQNASGFTLTNSKGDVINVNLFHGFLEITVSPAGDKNVMGMAVIVSKYINNQWKRNNARIVLVGDPNPIYTYAQWRATYEKTGASAKYLNQGDEGTGING